MKLPSWLARPLQRSQRRSDILDDPLEAIRRELDKPPEAIDLGALVPVLVPSAFSDTGAWPGPIYRLVAPGFDQTWAVLGPNDVMTYVSRATQAFWEHDGTPWRNIAANNLRAIAEAEPYSHEFARPDGSPFMVAMLYGRGLGPSRLLVTELLATTFPDGYEVAVPEMTCAVAFTTTPTRAERERIDDFVSQCFENGSEPVNPAHFKPDLFWAVDSDDLGSKG